MSLSLSCLSSSPARRVLIAVTEVGEGVILLRAAGQGILRGLDRLLAVLFPVHCQCRQGAEEHAEAAMSLEGVASQVVERALGGLRHEVLLLGVVDAL